MARGGMDGEGQAKVLMFLSKATVSDLCLLAESSM